MQKIGVLTVVILLAACGTTVPTKQFNNLSTDMRASETPQAKVALEEDFQKALELCDTTMNDARTRFDGSGKIELSMASIGIIAGSLVVPSLAAKAAASKSAIAGWGGVSGAANAAQYTLQQKGVSANRVAVVYEETRKEIRLAAAEYATATTNAARIRAVTKLSLACRYPVLPGIDITPIPSPQG